MGTLGGSLLDNISAGKSGGVIIAGKGTTIPKYWGTIRAGQNV